VVWQLRSAPSNPSPLQSVLPGTEPTASAAQLSARFGRKSPKRTEQIVGMLETLRGLGHV
jgi:hypothetical protein